MKKIFLILFVILTFFSTKTLAVELSLQDCIDMAIEKNKGLKTFEMEVLARRREVKISKTHFFPSLKFKGESTFRDESDQIIFKRNIFSKGYPAKDIEVPIENRNTYGINLVIEQPLFTGGQLIHSHRKSKVMKEEGSYDTKRQKRLLIFQVESAFYQFLKEQSIKKALAKIIEYKEERLSLLKKRHKEGYVKKEEIFQVETDLAFAQFDLYKCENRQALALSRLKQLIYYQENEEIFLKGKLLNISFNASFQEALEAAQAKREDLKGSLLKIKAIEEDIAITKSEYYPQVSLMGRYTLQKETNMNRPQIWALGARIDWLLFDWGRVRAKVSKKEALRQRLLFQHEELQRNIMVEVEEAWRAIKEKENLVKAHEKKIKFAEYRFGLIKERYSEGTIMLVEVIEMETELINSYSEYLIAISGLDIELAYLKSITSAPCNEWYTIEEIYQLKL